MRYKNIKKWVNRACYSAFIGIREVADRIWQVSFME